MLFYNRVFRMFSNFVVPRKSCYKSTLFANVAKLPQQEFAVCTKPAKQSASAAASSQQLTRQKLAG